MEKRRTIGQYRSIDLAMFALMLIAAEALIVSAATRWFPGQPYTVSAVPAVVAIVLMRWGPFAGIHAVLGGAVFCLASGANALQYAVYCIGNLAGLASLLLVRWLTAQGIREDGFKTMMFGVITALLMQAGRGAVSLLVGAGWSDLIRFFTTDVISVLFAAVVVWIAGRQDGVFEDQKNYLLRVSQEEDKEKEYDDEGES